jgi:hypothetical protein
LLRRCQPNPCSFGFIAGFGNKHATALMVLGDIAGIQGRADLVVLFLNVARLFPGCGPETEKAFPMSPSLC